MKKLTSFVLAMASTMLLVIGADKTASRLDPLDRDEKPAVSDSLAQAAGMPCVVVGEPDFVATE